MLRRKYFFLRGGPVVSDEGFSVSFKDRTKILYEDEMGGVVVSGEQMAKISNWAVYPNRMHVGSFKGPKLEDAARRQLVLSRIAEVAKFQGMTIEVDQS
jgi:hypothetical protein